MKQSARDSATAAAGDVPPAWPGGGTPRMPRQPRAERALRETGAPPAHGARGEHTHGELVSGLGIEGMADDGSDDILVEGGTAVEVVYGKEAGGDGEEAEVETGANGCVGEGTRRGGLADGAEVRSEERSLSEGQRAQWRLSSEHQARHLGVGY